TDHLLRQGETLAAVFRRFRLLEQSGRSQTQLVAGLLGQAAADDQRDTVAGADILLQYVVLLLEGSDKLVATLAANFALVGVYVDDVAHGQVGAVEFDRQSAGVFHGVVEDRGNLGTEAETTGALVRHVGDVVTEEPQHRVGGGLAGRT